MTDRSRRQTVRRTLAAGALAIVLASATTACSSDGVSDEEEAAQERLVDAATTSTAPATTTTEAPTTTFPAATGLPGQEEAVKRLYDAWFADDPATAATVADQSAIDGIWQAARGDYSLYSACSTGEFDTSGCLYRGAPGTIQFTLERRGENWVVIEAFYSDPSSGG